MSYCTLCGIRSKHSNISKMGMGRGVHKNEANIKITAGSTYYFDRHTILSRVTI